MDPGSLKVDGNFCFSGCQLQQIKERAGGQPKLGLVCWRKIPLDMVTFFANCDDLFSIRSCFSMWMDEKEIRACCPRVLSEFLAGVTTRDRRQGTYEGDEEEQAMVETMRADVVSLVERCRNALQKTKRGMPFQNKAAVLLDNNTAILAAYAKVPELSTCLLKSGVVELSADIMLLKYREYASHKNSGEALRSLVKHPCIDSTEVILSLLDSIRLLMDGNESPVSTRSHFEELTLTIMELFASTVNEDCCHTLKEMSYTEVPGRIVYKLLEKYLKFLQLIETRGTTCCTGSLTERFELATLFTDLIGDLFAVMGWSGDLLKGNEDSHSKQGAISIFTGLIDNPSQPVRPLDKYKTRKHFSSDQEYGHYMKSVLKEGMWVRAKCSYDVITAGDQGKFRCSNSRTPPAQFEWEGLGGDPYWIHWHMVELIVSENDEDKKQSPSTGVAKKKHPYGLNVVVNRGNAIKRTDWWEVLYYIKKLDGADLNRLLPILSSYKIKTFDDLIEILPSVQEANQVIRHLRQHHPLLMSESLVVEDSSAHQPRPQTDNNSSADQVIIKACPPMVDPCPNTDTTSIWGVTRTSIHEPSHLGRGYSSSCVEISFGPEHIDSSSDQDDDEITINSTVTTATTSDVVEPVTNSNIAGDNTSNAGLRRSSRIAVMPKKSFADMAAGKFQSTSAPTSSQTVKKKKKKKSLDYSAMEMRLNLASSNMLTDYGRFCATVDEVLKSVTGDNPQGYRTIARCLTLMQNGLQNRNGRLLVEDALSGGFKTILHAMRKGSHSAYVQRLGIICFYNQMGRCSFGYSVTNVPCDLHRREERNSIMAIMSSLVSGQEHGGLRTLVDGLYCAANQYNKEMSDAEKRSSVEAVNHGLVVLANVLHSDMTLLSKMADWQLPKCLEMIRKEFPVFPGKEQLMGMMNRFPINNNSPPLPDENYCQEISTLVQRLEESTCQTAVFQLLGKIGGRSLFDGNTSLITPPEMFVRSILHYRGIAKLVNLLEKSRSLSPSVCSDIIVIIGCVVKAGNQYCSEVILQGGFRGIVSVLNQLGDSRRLQLLAIQVLHRIWQSSEDNRSATKTKLFENCLFMLLEKYEKDEEVMVLLRELKITTTEVEDMSSISQKVLIGVLAGTVQLIIQHINDCRRYQDHVMLPRLATLVQYMSSVQSGLAGIQEQCWDTIDVSSGSFRKDQLTDGNKHTYWESSGHTGSHWIRLHIKKNIVIKSLAISVNSSDSSYVPQKVAIEGGGSVDHMTVLANVTVEPNTNGEVNLLGNQRKHYPIITIKIKKCSQGGIDTRIHGLTMAGSEFNPMWSVFGEVLSTATGVFYNMLTYTWSQELAQSDLLDLFDRLSDRVTYEQSFADMYLQSTVAKESLGQACHQYLIQPMAKLFTQKGGDKKLADLIGCYLQRMYCPTIETIIPVANDNTSSCDYVLSAEDWVSMSRIRCMCRMLVDCSSFSTRSNSSSSSSNTALTASNKQKSKQTTPSLTTSSSSDALVRCWKDTVKHHVEQTLNVVLADGKPHTVATGLLNIYNKLKCAMRELFGGHSRYAIALKEGFAEQLQALSEPNSVQFCQSFCLSIDSLLNVNGPDHHQLSATMETEREAILSQLAEPLQFIHNLDLSHVFEHYYRNHLSVRILNGWSISLPMERRLVQMFTHCFPHKYPMLMLADLDQSKQLMDKFCDSELLEGLDMILAGSRLHAPQRSSFSIPADVTRLAQKRSFYKQHTLHVYTLTPCHWHLNYQPLPPLQTLPHPLQQFCTDYQSYFCSATRDEEQVRNKKLEWTVYGSGCLSYDRLRLMVSTAQMIVLLQYNKSEVYKFHSLQANTHLGEELLSHTLSALTTEPQNILVASSSSQHGVYSPNTTFKLNQQFTSQVAKQHNPQQYVWIHSGQYTTSHHSNRQVDLAHLFERRRNIMDAAIVRLLKRDREVSTDTITSYVIKGCSVGQFEGGPLFERFDCDSHDVCFRIDRLILDGYLHRCNVKPRIIHYQPSTMELLPSNGQPGSHDPRRALSISRKRPLATSSKTPSGSAARTKKRSVECTSHSHIVTKTMTNSSLTFEEVQSLIIAMVNRISEVTKLPTDQVEWLLRRHQWSEDTVMQNYISLNDDILTEVGLTKTSASSSEITSGNCRVCLNDVSNIMRLLCGHELCQSCCKQYLMTRLSQSVPLDTTCPILSCKQPVTHSTFQQLLTPEVMTQYELAVVKSYVEMSKWFTWCRNPQGCGMALRKADGSQSGTCNKCHWSSCFNCTFSEAHEPASCKDITQWVEAGGFYEGMGEDAKSKQLSKMISKLCPGCSAPIEKNEGCLHMKCKCGCDFCWRCLKPWKPSHTDYFSCTAKESKAAQDVKKFVDYNQRCSQHHTSYGFARRLCQLVNSITEPVNMNHLSFIIDACELLAKCHKLLAYASVSEFFRNKRVVDAFSFLTEDLEGDTNALQAFLENTLLSTTSGVANSISKLPERQLVDGYQLLNKINSTRDKLSIGADQLRFGVATEEPPAEVIPSRMVGTTSTITEVWYNSDEDNNNNNNMYDDEPYSSSERYDDSPYYYGSPYYDSDCYSF